MWRNLLTGALVVVFGMIVPLAAATAQTADQHVSTQQDPSTAAATDPAPAAPQLHDATDPGNDDPSTLSTGAAATPWPVVHAPATTLETLIPDFKANKENIQRIIDAAPEVVSHNIETTERLTRQVRIQAKYWQSMETLKILKAGGMRTKSGIMLGLGEAKEEVIETLKDLKACGVDVVTIGQYLQPTKKHLPVARFVHPDEFAEFREIGYNLGLDYVESGPLVRSSYHSEKHVIPGYGKNKWMEEKSL